MPDKKYRPAPPNLRGFGRNHREIVTHEGGIVGRSIDAAVSVGNHADAYRAARTEDAELFEFLGPFERVRRAGGDAEKGIGSIGIDADMEQGEGRI